MTPLIAKIGNKFMDEEGFFPSLALACLFSVIPGVLFLRNAIASDLSITVVVWLCCVTLIGITLNSSDDRRLFHLILGSLASTLIINVVMLMIEFLQGTTIGSSLTVNTKDGLSNNEIFFLIIRHLLVTIFTPFGILAASLARPKIIGGMSSYFSINPERLKIISQIIILAIVSIVTVLFDGQVVIRVFSL